MPRNKLIHKIRHPQGLLQTRNLATYSTVLPSPHKSQRMGSLEEVSSAVVFLPGEEGSGITCTDVVVDGGAMANLWLLDTLPE